MVGGVAEDERDAAIGIPAVEMLGLGKVGVAAEQDRAKAGTQASGDGLVQGLGRSLMGRTIAGAIDDAERFAGVGQGNKKGMIAPGAVVSDVHAQLALAGGGKGQEEV